MRRLLLALALAACAPRTEPEPQRPPVQLFVNAVVYTMDSAWPRAEAIAVQEGRILAVGHAAQIDLAERMRKIVAM